MKTLLRSCFVADSNDNESLIIANYHAMVESGLGFDTPEDNVIWAFIQDFFKGHGHAPTLQTMRSHYERVQELDAVDRLERLALIKPRTRGDFITYLENKASDKRTMLVIEMCKEMAKIASTGIELKDGKTTTKLFGALDACRYFFDKSHDIVAPTLGSKLSGNLMTDKEDFLARYDRIKADPMYGMGQWCGISQIDTAINGAKKYELWVHTAYTGGLKSSWALHWAYVQAVYYGCSSIYFSLEMPYIQCRNLIAAMHSAHEDFADIRIQLGITTLGLDYGKIRDGQLNPNEEKFLREYVVPSIFYKTPTCKHNGSEYSLDPKNYGDMHIEVADPDKSDFTIADMRSRAELIFSKTPFSLIFIDHLGLMAARGRHPNTTEKLNEVVRDAKRLAMSFNRGMGIAIVGLFQISREGFKAAEKNGGRYNLTHLAYANECIVRGTPVPTDVGVLPIEEVAPGMRVWSRSGWKKVHHRFDQGARSVWRILNDRGEILEATAEHKVRVLSKEKIQWRRIDKIKEGDLLLSSAGAYPWPADAPKLPALEIRKYEKPNGEQGTPLRVPSTLTLDLAWLLGAWDGDGKIHPKGVAFTGNRLEISVRDRIMGTFFRCFGHPIGLLQSPSRPGSFDLAKWSQPLKRWVEDLAELRGEVVPRVIKTAPKEMVLAYIKGLWDTDGWVNNQGVVGIKMKSESYLREVQFLMSALGFDTCLEPNETTLEVTGKTYPGWTLRLRGSDSKRKFQRELGFSELPKAIMLEETFADTQKDKRTYPVGKLFATLASDYTTYKMIKAGRFSSWYHKNIARGQAGELISHGVISTLVRILDEDSVVDDRSNLLREILGLRVTQVRSVDRNYRVEEVYDLEVDGDHEYQTGPFLSHNCERSADTVTACYLDDNLRRLGRAIFQCLKSRDTKPFDRISVRIEFACRRFLTDNTAVEEVDEKIKSNKGEYSKMKPELTPVEFDS